MSMTLHPPQPRLDVEQRRRQPALPLVRGLPGVDLGATLLDQRVRRLDAVGGLERLAEQLVDAESVERERLLEALGQARRRRLVAALELAVQLRQLRVRLLVGGPVVGALQSPAPAGLLALRQVAHHVLALVPHAALHQRFLLEHLAHRRAQALAAVDHHQQSLREVEAPLDQRAQEEREHLLVLGVGLDEAQESLGAIARDPQPDHQRRVGEALAVQEQRHVALPRQLALLKLLELRPARFDEGARHRRTRQADRSRDRARRRLVVAARDPVQHPSQQRLVRGPRAVQSLVAPQRELGLFAAHPRHPDRHLLPVQHHRPRITSVTRPGRAVRVRVARTRQRFDLLVEQHLNVHQSQWDQTPDQLHLRVRLQSLVLLAPQHPDLAQTPLAPPHASYDTAHRRLLSSEVSGRLSTPSHHSGWSRFNFQLRISHLLCTAPRDQRPPILVADGSGGAIVAWADERQVRSEIYAQHVDALGVPRWMPDGMAVASSTGSQFAPVAAPDGAGGAIIVWMDSRNGPCYVWGCTNIDLFAARVEGTGALTVPDRDR